MEGGEKDRKEDGRGLVIIGIRGIRKRGWERGSSKTSQWHEVTGWAGESE
jgi:hypothetical protein